ncbi:hypothetical protein TRVL_04417 [Trypanosoma vivax]|nr:hypothetical protein TRVL_04417 [Trypanosoma vivax]
MEGPALLDILVPRNFECLNNAKVDSKSCSIQYDRILNVPVLIMKGDPSNARVQIPRDGSSLSSVPLPHSLIVLQTYLGSFDSFALEVSMTVLTSIRVKLVIGTHFTKASVEDTKNGLIFSRMPLIVPRNRWVQIVFHVSGIVVHLLDLPPIKFIESISLSGTCKASRLMTSSDEEVAINATPSDMMLFAVPAYAPPIWRTAASTGSPGQKCKGTNGRQYTSGSKSSYSPYSRLPVLGDLSTSKGGSNVCTRQDDSSKTCGLPLAATTMVSPYKPLESSIPEVECVQLVMPVPCYGGQQEGHIGNLTCDCFGSLNPLSMQQQDAPRSESAAYIRLVSTNVPQRSNSNPSVRLRTFNSVPKESAPLTSPALPPSANLSSGACSPVMDTSSAISGWEENIWSMNAAISVSPRRVEGVVKGKLPCVQSTAGDKVGTSSSGGGNAKSTVTGEQVSNKAQRLKKMLDIKRRPFLLPSRRRRAGDVDGQSHEDGDTSVSTSGTARRRNVNAKRLRLRRRIRMLKEAQCSARRVQELKKLPASELPIDLKEEALMVDGDHGLDLVSEPRCGYGFGYLGVLHESGGFEAEEGADTKLRGALILELSEVSEDEENDAE